MEKKTPKIKKRTILNGLFLIGVILLTVFSVLHGENIGDLLTDISKADGKFLLLAVCCVIVYLILQGVVIYLLCRALHLQENLKKCILISMHGYFYCSITPFQSGGPPIQIVDMKKEGIRIPTGSIIVLIVSFMYKLVLVVVSAGILFFGQHFIREYLGSVIGLFGLGVFLTCGFTFLIGLVIFHPRMAKKVVVKMLGWLERRHIMKPKEGRKEKLIEAMDRYRSTAGFFRSHRKLMIVVFLITFLQRFSFFAADYFVYRSFHLAGHTIFLICLMQAVINISVDMLPVPGGMGFSEAMFLSIFKPVFGALITPGMVMCRGITYYVQLLICAFFSIVARFVFSLDRSKMGKFQKAYGIDETGDEEQKEGAKPA
ncbi:MAG: lysylphosphatidylglycerol synthase transmembrane domain-containing protein [Eubacterium sp.]|nr:lysylphosphatidylglycerol synthase transmembrane domain-containing protein [Eubacterium sp.]